LDAACGNGRAYDGNLSGGAYKINGVLDEAANICEIRLTFGKIVFATGLLQTSERSDLD